MTVSDLECTYSTGAAVIIADSDSPTAVWHPADEVEDDEDELEGSPPAIDDNEPDPYIASGQEGVSGPQASAVSAVLVPQQTQQSATGLIQLAAPFDIFAPVRTQAYGPLTGTKYQLPTNMEECREE